jgi:5'-nucleotidase (lipoprotein e(P4) family)
MVKKRNITTIMAASFMSLSLIAVKTNAQQAVAPKVNLQEQNIMSALWFQTSGEAKALYYQSYNIGKLRLDGKLAEKSKQSGLKPAIILDIDETIVDNSPRIVWNIKNKQGPTFSWKSWVNRAQAKALPGAIEFLKYAESKGVEIYYISNRDEINIVATIQNLKKIGAPMADREHVLLQKPNEIGKESRRMKVAKTHDIVLLFGDNLGDFSGFDHLSPSERVNVVDRRREEFGKKLIVFPNPMYGDWEDAIYNYNKQLTDQQKDKLRKTSLQP